MDEEGLPWFWCAWPTSNGLADSSDAGIVRAALQAITPRHRFAFVHLQELDGWGHLYGPDSPELRARVHDTDGLVAELLKAFAHACQRLNSCSSVTTGWSR